DDARCPRVDALEFLVVREARLDRDRQRSRVSGQHSGLRRRILLDDGVHVASYVRAGERKRTIDEDADPRASRGNQIAPKVGRYVHDELRLAVTQLGVRFGTAV